MSEERGDAIMGPENPGVINTNTQAGLIVDRRAPGNISDLEEVWAKLSRIDVKDKIKTKDGLSYLSWAYAWDILNSHYPDVSCAIEMNEETRMPYFMGSAGAIVYVNITIKGITKRMWLPVMDYQNRAMKDEAYSFKTKKGERFVTAITMMEVNKALMRCLVKCAAMFGLALYIYEGEDFPSIDPLEELTPIAEKIVEFLEEKEDWNAYCLLCPLTEDQQTLIFKKTPKTGGFFTADDKKRLKEAHTNMVNLIITEEDDNTLLEMWDENDKSQKTLLWKSLTPEVQTRILALKELNS